MTDTKKEASVLPIVVKQSIDLKIDTLKHSVHGTTRLICRIPEGCSSIQLHASTLNVVNTTLCWEASTSVCDRRVLIEPSILQIEHENVHNDEKTDFISRYEAKTRQDLAPELTLPLPPHRNGDADDLAVDISFNIERPRAGIHFCGEFAVTDNEICRASAWTPCLDRPNAATLFQLRLTVPAGCHAVASGHLVKQTWADAGHQWRTFHYDVAYPCAPCDIGFAVGPFLVVPGSTELSGLPDTLVTHFFPRLEENALPLEPTSLFFNLPFKLFSDEILRAKFPLPSMQQVFLPPEAARVPVSTFVGLQILSTDLMINPRSIEQSQEARCKIAGALTRQWFGHYIRPATVDDAWLVEGLTEWLEEQYVKQYMGKTELAYRRWNRREIICALDNGDAPPLAFGYPGVSPWGPLNGTEKLDPSPLRRLKASAVVRMLERRAGEDLFRKHVESLIAEAITGSSHEEETARTEVEKASAKTLSIGEERAQQEGHSTDATLEARTDGACVPKPEVAAQPIGGRLVDSTAFLNELSRAGDFRREAGVFLERWVKGRGVPSITLGSVFQRKKGCTLEVAIRQVGSAAAKDAANAAELEAQREGIGTGVIKVSVREGSGATVDHPVHVGTAPLILARLGINPDVKKIHAKRGRKRKDEEDLIAEKQAELENAQHPVQFVRLDPGGEWLCAGRVLQSERMLKNQLRDSKDVVAQSEAVRGIGQLRLGLVGQGPLKLLGDALSDKHLHCRVRMEAARALGTLKDDLGEPVGLRILLRFYKERYWDENNEEDESVRPTSFYDVSEYLVAKAVVAAIASATAADGSSELDAVWFLKLCVEQFCSAWEAYDDRGLLSSMCSGLGLLKAPKGENELAVFMCNFAFVEIERHLESELASPSPAFVVGRACLDAMVDLVGSGTCPQDIVESIGCTLVGYCSDKRTPLALRTAAHRAFARFLAGLKGWDAAFEFAIEYISISNGALSRAVWEEIAALAASAETVPEGILERAAELAISTTDRRLRHLAFVTVRRLQHKPPTLFDPGKQHQTHQKLKVISLRKAVLDGDDGGPAPSEVPSAVPLGNAEENAAEVGLGFSVISSNASIKTKLPLRLPQNLPRKRDPSTAACPALPASSPGADEQLLQQDKVTNSADVLDAHAALGPPLMDTSQDVASLPEKATKFTLSRSKP